MTEVLGERMYYAVFMIRGRPDRAECSRLLDQVIKWAGMHKASDYRAAIWEYPTPAGAGGQGLTAVKPVTIVQPFVEATPLEESYAYVFLPVGVLAADTYVEHNHFFLEIASCRRFDPGKILNRLAERGWEVIGHGRMPVGVGTAPRQHSEW